MNDITITSGVEQLDLFYSSLDPSIAAKARAAAERVRGRMALAAESIVEIGRELIEQKVALGHGNFLDWIAAEFSMSQATAYRMIAVAERFEPGLISLRSLGRDALYALAAPSTPDEVRDAIETLTTEGRTFTATDVKELIVERERIKAELDEADRARVEALDAAKKRAENERKKIEKAVAKALKEAGQGDAEKLAAQEARITELTAEIDAIQNSPVMQALRDSVEQAAKDAKGGKTKRNRNPLYEPNPSLDKTLMLIGPVRALAERIPKMDPAEILAGFIDENDRANGLSAVRICRDFLTTLLEEADAARD